MYVYASGQKRTRTVSGKTYMYVASSIVASCARGHACYLYDWKFCQVALLLIALNLLGRTCMGSKSVDHRSGHRSVYLTDEDG